MGALSSLALTGLNLALSQQAASRRSQDIGDERDRHIQEIQARTREENWQRRDELRRRLAAERARASAAGVATRGGSSDAVLRGLVEKAELDEHADATDARRKIADLRRSASTVRRNNLLDLASGALGGLFRSSSGRSSLLG